MISKFKNIFKKSDIDEKNAFRQKVLGVLREMFPTLEFTTDNEADVIYCGELTLGLTNIHSKFLLTSQTEFELKELVSEHFAGLFEISEMVEQRQKQTWEDIKSLVMPQLMPTEYLEKMPVVNFPFGDEICIGIVIDDEKSYSYLTKDDVERLEISEDEIYETAVGNLADKSNDIPMTFVPPPNGLIVIDTMDSFDAIRIIVPHIIEFIAEKLGGSFYFGVPNRDFLICWSKLCDEEFQRNISSQVASDFDERPYPLSKCVFEVSEKYEITQVSSFESEVKPNRDWSNN